MADANLQFDLTANTQHAQTEVKKFRQIFSSEMTGVHHTGRQAFSRFQHDATNSVKGVERDAQKSFANIKRDAKEAGASMSSSFLGGVGQIASGVLGGSLLTSALSTLGSALKSEITTAFDFLDLQERSKIAFTTIFKNAGLSAEEAGEKAKAHIQELIDFGAKTPFRTDQLIELSQRFQAVGYKANEVVPTLRAVGDAVAGLGGSPEKLESIVAALTKIKTTGRLGGEELRTFGRAGVNALKYLSEYSGKSVDEIRQKAERNQLDAEVASKVIRAGMEREFKGMMKATEGTYSSMWSTIEDLNQQRAGEAFKPAFDEVKKGMAGAITGMSSSAAQSFTQGAAGVQKVVIGGFDAILSSLATGDFKGLGFGAIESVTKGAKDAAGGLYKEGVDAGAQLEQGWRDKMDQHSPSQVMLKLGYDAGASVAFGFVQGARSGHLSDEVQKIIEEAAEKFKIDPDLIRAVIGQESSGRPGAVSPKGARGLMQLMPGTAARFGVSDIHDPRQNIMGGTEYLAFLLARFRGDVKLALAGYNAGEGAVDKYHGIPPYAETQNYVKRITGHYDAMKQDVPRTSSGTLDMARMSTGQQWNALLQIPEFRKWFQSTYGAGRTDIPGLNDLPSSAGEFIPPARAGKSSSILTPAMMAHIEALGFGTDGDAALPIGGGTNLAAMLASVPSVKLDGLKASIIDTKKSQYEFLKSLADIAPTTEEATNKAGNALGGLGSLSKKTQDNHGYFSGTDRYVKPPPKSEEGDDGGSDQIAHKATAAEEATASLHATLKDVKSMGKEAFGEFAQGIGATVEQYILLGKTGPDALRKVTAQTLASLSKEATIKALMALADGLVHLFTNPAQSAADFTAAAIYGSIAVASGIAGRIAAGNVFSKEQGDSSAGNGTSSGTSTSSSNQPSVIEASRNSSSSSAQRFHTEPIRIQIVSSASVQEGVVHSMAINAIRQDGRAVIVEHIDKAYKGNDPALLSVLQGGASR
jgi:tape measure domain-containing protein